MKIITMIAQQRLVRVRRIDDRAIELWTTHIGNHAVQPQDRYSLRELGFRTHVYAELLRRGASLELNALSEVLWKFVPGVWELRELSRPRHTVSGSLVPLREGIVMAVTSNTVLAALQTITVLRSTHKCILPIEVYHYGASELDKPLKSALESMRDVRVIDIYELPYFSSAMEDDAGRIPNGPESQARQAMALLATKFQRVVLSAPDITWMADPALLFQQQGFLQTGTFLFRERGLPATARAQRMVSWLKDQFDESWPSQRLSSLPFWDYVADGVMTPKVAAFDKSRAGVFSALLANLAMHQKSSRDHIWSRFSQGQVESLFLSFELSNMPYHLTESTPGAVGSFVGNDWFGSTQQDGEASICSARAVHFLSQMPVAPLERHNGSSSIYSGFSGGIFRSTRGVSSKAVRAPQPLWLDAPIFETRTTETFFNATAWAMHGRWEMDVTQASINHNSPWCFRGATLRSVDQLGSTRTNLDRIKSILRQCNNHFRPLVGLFAAMPVRSEE
ncbi:hypothetical protein CBOM_03793 [Ceraceosorus bombacis]|uniref:Uncharacterized protein n=1 Tax=Ceraceosorus bombacis TaxID=401625 RepID=A0A0P1BIK4_9BASI|nr:hypothetical protein CBOM_03793 [Ceraceosorus bombacis]